jgi:hypothetical protein
MLKAEMSETIVQQRTSIKVDYFGCFGISDGDQLLSNDTQYFDIDSIEFIKTRPSTLKRQDLYPMGPGKCINVPD